MTGVQAPPAHRTLASELRWVRANLPADTPQSVTRALDAATERAETEATQARIWHGEAEQRERSEELLERVRKELERLTRVHADQDGPLDQHADGARAVIAQISQALGEQ